MDICNTVDNNNFLKVARNFNVIKFLTSYINIPCWHCILIPNHVPQNNQHAGHLFKIFSSFKYLGSYLYLL